MTGLKLERAKAMEISALGCAYLTGLVCGEYHESTVKSCSYIFENTDKKHTIR